VARRQRGQSAGRRAAEARLARRGGADSQRSATSQPAEERAEPAGPPDGWSELLSHPLVRGGFYAWALIGLLAVAVAALFTVAQLRLVIVPILLALFPAALLTPVSGWLRRRGFPPGLAAVVTLLGSLALLVLVVQFIVVQVIDQWPRLAQSALQGFEALQAYLETGPLGIDPTWIRDTTDTAQERLFEADLVRTGVLGVAGAVAEIVAMTLLLLVVLFFYLKDGVRIAQWLRNLFPQRAREDVGAMGTRAWTTIAAYIRGQLLVALVDAVFIGIGLAILRVPLALPLAVLVFFGGLFPIVGAVVTGALAVLVALADRGLLIALIALAIVIVVQQIESNVLAPMVLGKATELHPLAVLTSLTAGGILLGVLGAFIAVPITASLVRAIGYLRQRHAAVP
jgi:putative heme transporter